MSADDRPSRLVCRQTAPDECSAVGERGGPFLPQCLLTMDHGKIGAKSYGGHGGTLERMPARRGQLARVNVDMENWAHTGRAR